MAAKPAAPRLVALLLDEMHAPAAARALRARGIDAVAVAELEQLRGLPDDDILAWAVGEGRAVVTENVRDFLPIVEVWTAARRAHAGLVLTNPRRFPRASSAYPGVLIAALDDLARSGWPAEPSLVCWLAP